MPRKAAQSPQLAVLAARLEERLGKDRLAQNALADVKHRPPDDPAPPSRAPVPLNPARNRSATR